MLLEVRKKDLSCTTTSPKFTGKLIYIYGCGMGGVGMKPKPLLGIEISGEATGE